MPSPADLREKIEHGTKENPISALHFSPIPELSNPPSAVSGCFFVQRHWHAHIEILLIRKGTFSLELNLENHILKEGDICIFNSGELHQITGQCPSTVHDAFLFDPCILDFSYPDEWQEQWIRPFLNHSLVIRHLLDPDTPGYPKIRDFLEQLLHMGTEKKEGWYIRSKLLLLELFACLSENNLLLPNAMQPAAEMQKISRYKAIVSYIESHYSEPVSLAQIAAQISCNHQYLCRFFKDIAGITPIQYLILYRIDRAAFLLANTDQPILEIAMDCGFENVSYFIRKFKETKGCTPKEYRKQAHERYSLYLNDRESKEELKN